MRSSNPLIVISPAVPADINESEARRDPGRLVARLVGASLVLFALGATCLLSLEAIGL